MLPTALEKDPTRALRQENANCGVGIGYALVYQRNKYP